MIRLPVAEIQFMDGGNTLWVHAPDGSTTLRIKTTGKFKATWCKDSPVSHGDMLITGDQVICIGTEAAKAAPQHFDVDIEAIKFVIAEHRYQAATLSHDPESKAYLEEQIDRLTAALGNNA